MASYNIFLAVDPSGSGTTKIGSVVASGATQEEGTNVSILAIANEGFAFVGWYDNNVLLSSTPDYSFVMPPNDILLVALFEPTTTNEAERISYLYDTECPKFFLIQDFNERFFSGDMIDLSLYLSTEVEEPIGFDDGKFKLERDSKYHGFNYEFAVDNLRYELGSVGNQYLKDRISSEGIDADVKFAYGFGDMYSFTLFYLGKVDFTEYKETENGDYVEFGLRELDFDNLLQTAFDVPQQIELDTDVVMFSKVLPKKIEYATEIPEDVFGLGVGLSNNAWFKEVYRFSEEPYYNNTYPSGYLYFNNGRVGSNDLEDFYTYDFQLDDELPTQSKLFIGKSKEAGLYRIDVRLWLGIRGSAGLSNLTNLNFFKLKLQVNNPQTSTLTTIADDFPNEVLTTTQLLSPKKIAVFDRDFVIEAKVDDEIYLFIELDSSLFPSGEFINALTIEPFNYDRTVPQISIVAETFAKESNIKFISGYNAINKAVKSTLSSDYDPVKSSFLEEGGCGSLLFLTNGFNVRGLTNKPLTASPKKLIDGLSNIFCMGWGVEYNSDKKELLRIEPAEYFYRDVEILKFENVSEYTKEVDSSLIYNELEVSFSKYSKEKETDKGFSLDDLHTNRIYQTPVKTNKNKFNLNLDIVMSAHLLESLRRKQFEKDKPNKESNYSEDEDVFGVNMSTLSPVETIVYENNKVTEGENYTFISGVYNITLNAGDVVNYTSKAGVTTTRTVSFFFVSSYNILDTTIQTTNIWFDDVLSSPNTGTNDVVIQRTVTGGALRPEGNENFLIVSRVLSPATTINLRFTPLRILLNWAKLINQSFIGKDNDNNIIFKQGDGNIEALTVLKNNFSCPLGDVNKAAWYEKENFGLSKFYNREYLFSFYKVSFSTPLSFKQLIYLKRCLRGQEITDNYGYVTVLTPCGTTEKVFITSVEYSGVREEATIEGYVK